MPDDSEPSTVGILAPATKGAMYIPIHGERRVNVYPIQEHELKTIAICNTQVTFWSSVASAAIGLIASCIWDMAAGSGPTGKAWAFIGFCVFVVVFSICVAAYHWREKESQIAQIKAETTAPIK